MAGAAPKSRLRRQLLVAAGAAGGALVVGGWLFYRAPDRLRRPAALEGASGAPAFNAWLRIGADGAVTVMLPRQEMGQGITTALPMLVAEELDCDFGRVRYEQAPVDAVYANATMLADAVPFRPDDQGWLARVARLSQYRFAELLGVQATGGSSSVRDAFTVMRQAGAAARSMLVTAAAKRWGVTPGECTTERGAVAHAASGQRLGYGELAKDAAALPVPADARPKSPSQFRLLGRPQPRIDAGEKCDGSAQFGCDVRLPGMQYAAILHCPVFGGALKSVKADKAKAMPGVKAVVELAATSTTAAAVAVVADGWWRAHTALDALEVAWDEGAHAALDTAQQRKAYAQLLESGKARAYEEVGDAAAALAGASRLVEADYEVPYLAHATMEPMNATALVKDGRCEIWVGNQAPTLVKWFAAKGAGVPSEAVTVHTPYLGGGFGRRSEVDITVEAASIAARLPGVPVQLVWSREEDLRHDVYRPMALSRLRCALDGSGAIAAWHHRIVGQSCTGSLTARLLPAAASDAMKDKTTAEGAFDLPYAMPNRRVEHVLAHGPVPVGFWRSVGHSYNAYFVEAFLDEVARAAGKDPFEFRRAMLAGAPRHRRVLEAAAKLGGWGRPLAAAPGARAGRGIALAESFHSIVAQVAEVEVDAQRNVRVRRVACAIDCGKAVNPSTVVAQMESGIVFGLTAALYGEITLKGGRVEQGNFGDYPVLRIAECPAIEVEIVESGWERLGGVGEPGTPPIAPAVANAVFAATGTPVRRLPIRA
ncbi:MAG TPA: xanthine dehydrogenase family protein molybdopterin-binding subunit [Burkholderiales bacterium]|nr:xanthine dehydrogenase family protein molybdopterin-binding subunit [Burkholderiales bacterium]